MKTLVYLGTPGLGENIQMIPAWWLWRGPGDSLAAVLPAAQASSGLFNGRADKIIGHELRWARHGEVIIDDGLIRSVLGSGLPTEEMVFASRQKIELACKLPAGASVQERHPSPGGIPVVEGNIRALTGRHGTDADHRLTLNFPPRSNTADEGGIVLCSGSFEPMRSIPPSSMVALLRSLTSARVSHGRPIDLVLSSERYIDAVCMAFRMLSSVVRRICVDGGTPDTLSHAASIIHEGSVVISPDSGTAHLAYASAEEAGRTKLLFLPTREPGCAVFSDEQRRLIVEHVMPEPRCDMMCRGRRGMSFSVPNGYPWSLACSRGQSVPCLHFGPTEACLIAAQAVGLL